MIATQTTAGRPAAILDEVLRLRSLGLCLVPIAAGTKAPPKGFNRRKYHTQRPRRRDLERWFKTHENVAMVTGAVSGHVCGRDFEDRDRYYDWASEHAEIARTLPTIRTFRGFCVLFRTDGRDPALAGKAEHKQPDGELKVHSSLITLPPQHAPFRTPI